MGAERRPDKKTLAELSRRGGNCAPSMFDRKVTVKMELCDGRPAFEEQVQCSDTIQVLENRVRDFLPVSPFLALLGARGGILKSDATIEEANVWDGEVIRILDDL